MFLEYCPKTNQIWSLSDTPINLSSVDFKNWIQINTKTTHISKLNIPWNVIFIYTLHSIWLHRNKAVYQNEIRQPHEITRCALSKAAEFQFNEICSSSLPSIPKQPSLDLFWFVPPPSWYKLNVDGSMINCLFGVSGCITDDTGNWICGYSKFYGSGNALQGEL